MNAITLALIDAGIPMTDYVTACSIGLVSEGSLQTSWILDTNILEEQNSHQVPTMTTVFAPRNRQLLCMQMEPPSKISLDNLHGWMNAAKQATEIIYSKLNDIVKNAAK